MNLTETHEQPVTALRSGAVLGVPNLTRYNFNSLYHRAAMARQSIEMGHYKEAERVLAEIQDIADYCTRHGNTGDLKNIEQVRAALPGTPDDKVSCHAENAGGAHGKDTNDK